MFSSNNQVLALGEDQMPLIAHKARNGVVTTKLEPMSHDVMGLTLFSDDE